MATAVRVKTTVIFNKWPVFEYEYVVTGKSFSAVIAYLALFYPELYNRNLVVTRDGFERQTEFSVTRELYEIKTEVRSEPV